MKKLKLSFIAALLGGSLLFSSCVGSFALFNKVIDWNRGVGTKFVNELVFIACNIVPVYPVAALADVLVINSIEFWTGSNPVSADIGTSRTVKGLEGDYAVTTLENGYSIEKDGEVMQLLYNDEDQSWNVNYDGETTKLLSINNDGTASIQTNDGKQICIVLNQQGIQEAKSLMNTSYFADR